MDKTIQHIEIIEKEMAAAKQAMLAAEKTASAAVETAIAASNEIDASLASLAFVEVTTAILVFFPIPCGKTTAPRTCWSPFLVSTPNFI